MYPFRTHSSQAGAEGSRQMEPDSHPPDSEITTALQERFGIAATRAKTITFTEMHKSFNRGRVEGILRGAEAGDKLGIKTMKVWYHHDVGVPREDHWEYDGTAVEPDEMFNVGGEELEAPGLGSDPANNINCHCTAQLELDLGDFAQGG